MPDLQSPDTIAHLLATNNDSPARFYLVDEEATIPTTPYRNRGGVKTTTDTIANFDAVIESADIEDGGLTLSGFSGIHLPASEWSRIGLEKHWQADDVDLESPFTDPQRRLEVWASREENLLETSDADDPPYDHLENVPDDSPLITEWFEGSPDDMPDRPNVPFDRPRLYVYALLAEDARDPRGMDRIEIGEIAKVDILSENEIHEWPTEPDIETRELDVDLSSPPLHPDIDYDELEGLPHNSDVLRALHTINRYAKQFDEQAEKAYHANQGAQARAYSVRKRALYRSKTVAIHRLVKADPANIRIVRHELNGDYETFCFYIPPTDVDIDRPYSFHQPLDAVESEVIEIVTGSDDRSNLPIESISFEASSTTESLDMSLSEAISILRSYDLDPDEFLDQSVVEDFDTGARLSVTF